MGFFTLKSMSIMKITTLFLSFALASAAIFVGCNKKEDNNAPGGIKGSWEVVFAEGFEWEWNEDTEEGSIINHVDPDTEMTGMAVTVTNTQVTIGTFGTFGYTYSDGVMTINLEGESLVFNVTFEGDNEMHWEQTEPDGFGDYEYNEGSETYLYYQKVWSLERE
jgi:hypothetical protein